MPLADPKIALPIFTKSLDIDEKMLVSATKAPLRTLPIQRIPFVVHAGRRNHENRGFRNDALIGHSTLRVRFDFPLQSLPQSLSSYVEIVLCLQPEPELGGDSKESRQSQGSVG